MDPLVIKVPAAFPMVTLVGPADSNLRILENRFPQLSVTVRGNEIYVAGEPNQAKQFVNLVEELIAILRGGQNLTADLVRRSIDMIKQDPTEHPAEVLSLNILSNRGKTIRPKTANQKKYVDAIDQNTITFGIGPAGSGKTYLLTKLLKTFEEKKCYKDGKEVEQRIVLISPTAHSDSNVIFKSLKNLDWDVDVLPEYSDEILKDKIKELKKAIQKM